MQVRSIEVRGAIAQRKQIESKADERAHTVIMICEVETGLGSSVGVRRFMH